MLSIIPHFLRKKSELFGYENESLPKDYAGMINEIASIYPVPIAESSLVINNEGSFS